MLDLDEALFSVLIKDIPFGNKVIADVGCGTGRHWEKLYAKEPSKLIGFDVSEGMLNILKEKYPHAETHKLQTNALGPLEKNSCDILISTLAIAHIPDIESALSEWDRVLKPGGHIIITDYHPEALEKGGNRTFMHEGKMVSIKNYVHPIEQIKVLADKLHFKTASFTEKKIDESVKHYYEKQDAMHVFARFKGTNIIYGIHLIKSDAAT
jgi:ubiquinone/menaquinone biosynthesis C-methylase UbiE